MTESVWYDPYDDELYLSYLQGAKSMLFSDYCFCIDGEHYCFYIGEL